MLQGSERQVLSRTRRPTARLALHAVREKCIFCCSIRQPTRKGKKTDDIHELPPSICVIYYYKLKFGRSTAVALHTVHSHLLIWHFLWKQQPAPSVKPFSSLGVLGLNCTDIVGNSSQKSSNLCLCHKWQII